MLSPVLASCFLLLVPTSALSIAITGTNSGIGKSAASLLVAQGHTICRDVETSAGGQRSPRRLIGRGWPEPGSAWSAIRRREQPLKSEMAAA